MEVYKSVNSKKKCSKCKNEKKFTDFSKSKKGSYGLNSCCRDCQKKQYEENKNKKREYNNQYYQDNKEKIKSYRKKYYLNNREKINNHHKKYNKKKYKESVLFKTKQDIRVRLNQVLKGSKSTKSEEIIGCSWEQLLTNLNFNDFKKPSIDHIIPLSWAINKKEILALSRWENFQVLELEDNIKKGNFYCLRTNAENVLKIHPQPNLIKLILKRQLINGRYFNKQ